MVGVRGAVVDRVNNPVPMTHWPPASVTAVKPATKMLAPVIRIAVVVLYSTVSDPTASRTGTT